MCVNTTGPTYALLQRNTSSGLSLLLSSSVSSPCCGPSNSGCSLMSSIGTGMCSSAPPTTSTASRSSGTTRGYATELSSGGFLTLRFFLSVVGGGTGCCSAIEKNSEGNLTQHFGFLDNKLQQKPRDKQLSTKITNSISNGRNVWQTSFGMCQLWRSGHRRSL